MAETSEGQILKDSVLDMMIETADKQPPAQGMSLEVSYDFCVHLSVGNRQYWKATIQ